MIRLLIPCIGFGYFLSGCILYSQDFASLLDVAFANGECLQNYDVSYRISTFADFPKDKNKRDAVISAYKSQRGVACEEENEVFGRLLVDKESGSNPKRILFVKKRRIVKERKEEEVVEFMVWDRGQCVSGTTRNSRDEIRRGNTDLAKCYSYYNIPSFETYHGTLVAPRTQGYWEDHSVFWEWYKSQTAGIPLVRLRNGRLRFERNFGTMRMVSEYDPVSSLVVYFTAIPFEKETGNEILDLATPVRVTWENHKNVYRLKAVVAREIRVGVMYDAVSTFHWHQCNEESFEFPTKLIDELSLEKCTQFLIDGQSELSVGN